MSLSTRLYATNITTPPPNINGDAAVGYVLVPFFLVTVIGIAVAVNRSAPSPAAASVHIRPVRGTKRSRTRAVVEGGGYKGRSRLGQILPTTATSAGERCPCMTDESALPIKLVFVGQQKLVTALVSLGSACTDQKANTRSSDYLLLPWLISCMDPVCSEMVVNPVPDGSRIE